MSRITVSFSPAKAAWRAVRFFSSASPQTTKTCFWDSLTALSAASLKKDRGAFLDSLPLPGWMTRGKEIFRDDKICFPRSLSFSPIWSLANRKGESGASGH